MPSAEVQQVKQEQELSWPPDIQVRCSTIPVYLRDVWIRTQKAAVADRLARYQLSHPSPSYVAHFKFLRNKNAQQQRRGQHTLAVQKIYQNMIPVFHFRVHFVEIRGDTDDKGLDCWSE